MNLHWTFRLCSAALCATMLGAGHTQEAKPAGGADGKTTLAVNARLVLVPAVVFDKKGVVTNLTQSDFALSVDGKPQSIRYFDRDADVALTVGLLVDTSRSQVDVLDAEQRASQKFLDSFLRPANGNRPADRAFVLQFAHAAELLQDVTDSHSLLAASLKEIGTQAPGASEEESAGTTGSNAPDSTTGNTPTTSNPNNGGYGGYGRRSGYPGSGGRGNGGGGSGDTHGDRATGGTVLYDSIFLATDELLSRQKGRRALIVLTDGVDRHSKESLKEAIEAAQRADTVVYAIYYKGREAPHQWNGDRGYGGGYGGYDPYGRYPPTTGGSTDPGTYRDPDGRKILERICSETGGRSFELKGKGSVEEIYQQIGDELRGQYRLGFSPSPEIAGDGFHAIQLTLTNPAEKKLDIQTRDGVYLGAAHP